MAIYKENLFVLDKDDIVAFAGLYHGNIVEDCTPQTIAVGYVEDNKPTALIMGEVIDESNVLINWIYVIEEKRHRGIAEELIDYFIGACINTKTVHWVSALCPGEETYEYFNSLGFEFDEDKFEIYETTLDKLLAIPGKIDSSIIALENITDQQLRMLNQLLYTVDIVGVELPVEKEQYMPISQVCVDEKEVIGVLLLKELPDAISIAYAYCNSPKAMAMMMEKARQEVLKIYLGSHKVRVCALNESSNRLIDKVFAESSKHTLYKGYMNV